ncbi:hypothetical protein K450DRAFT_233396 [Umbelopsis ramanniana AG]|uniref:Uncharacterized protein n=1 Tax=Umbelopsis ramanniana AG TaxID=1314678 RepID=A0AAD5EDF4_UMBRA|nr:uncharacterized protein K450DRAFT_233396 [Umbelopsis ramanniana AG]KAI8581164.1 hypothetical protein K450DRAFT_233396 [Umbelopsis ramanniana AG]
MRILWSATQKKPLLSVNTMNPGALCLAGLAIVTMTVGLANTGTIVDFPPVVIGSCLTVAFISNVLAGLLELRAGNTFSAVSDICYGCYFLSYGIFLLPGMGGYSVEGEKSAQDLGMAEGIFYLPWLMFAVLMFLGTLRQSRIAQLIHGQVFMVFFLETVGAFTQMAVLTKISGWICIILSLTCYYTTASFIYNSSITPISLPIGV